MPQSQIPSSTPPCDISATSEPPSTILDPIVEAVTTLAVDPSAYSSFTLLCGNLKRPYLLLLAAELLGLLGLCLYGAQYSSSLITTLFTSYSDASSLIFAAIIQGIGYFIGEILYTKITALMNHHIEPNTTMHYYASLAKNFGLIFLGCAIYIAFPGIVADMACLALYALVCNTAQEIIATTSLAASLNHSLHWMVDSFRNGLKKVTLKHAFLMIIAMLFIGSGSIYAMPLVLEHSLHIFCVMMFSTIGALLSLLEQAIIYEYAYRASYVVLDVAKKPVTHMACYINRRIDNTILAHDKNFHLENSF